MSPRSITDLIGKMKIEIQSYLDDPVSATEEALGLGRGNLRPTRLHVDVKMVKGFHDARQFLKHSHTTLHCVQPILN